MRLLLADCDKLKLDVYNDERTLLPGFAILSHIWLAAEEVITFQYVGGQRQQYTDITNGLDDEAPLCQKAKLFSMVSHMFGSTRVALIRHPAQSWRKRLAEVCCVYLADMPGPGQSEGRGHSHMSKRAPDLAI